MSLSPARLSIHVRRSGLWEALSMALRAEYEHCHWVAATTPHVQSCSTAVLSPMKLRLYVPSYHMEWRMPNKCYRRVWNSTFPLSIYPSCPFRVVLMAVWMMVMIIIIVMIAARRRRKMHKMETIIWKKKKNNNWMRRNRVSSTSVCHGLVRECICHAMHVIRFVSFVVPSYQVKWSVAIWVIPGLAAPLPH